MKDDAEVDWCARETLVAMLAGLWGPSESPAVNFDTWWRARTAGGSGSLRIGDLHTRRWREMRAESGLMLDLASREDLEVLALLSVRRPVGRSHLSTLQDREECVLLAAAFYMDQRVKREVRRRRPPRQVY